MSKPRRARTDAAKADRRGAIVDAALAQLARTPFAEVTIASVADEVGVAKGTVFLYFGTKEALFLAAIDREMGSWFDDMDARLDKASRASPPGIDGVVAALGRSLRDRATLVKLLSLLHVVLEQNIDGATAKAFKQGLLARLTKTATRVEKALPFLREGDGIALLFQLYALILGLQQLADPAPVVAEVLRDPELRAFRVELQESLDRSARLLLMGWAAAAQEKSRDKKPKRAKREK